MQKLTVLQPGINRRQFLLSTGGALLALNYSARATAPARGNKPNVIYFFSDTHRWGALPFTQTPAIKTPYMERMLAEGVSMDRCYSNLPICSPFRGILLSGRWPWQQGIMANHMKLADRPDMPEGQKYRGTLGWLFKDAGYNTAYFGKSHWGGSDVRPFGFDKSITWNNTNNHVKNTFVEDGGAAEPWNRGASDDSNCTPMVTQALDWMDAHYDATEPFFAMISVNPPHSTMTDAPEGKKALYPGLDALPWHPFDELHEFDQHQGYHAHISDVDDEVGRILAQMRELHITNDTIFVYSSDHGGMSGVVGLDYGAKRNPEDESARVPFLIQWPGHIPANTRLDTLFSTIDQVPTLCSLANIAQHLDAAATPQAKESLNYLKTLPGVNLSSNILGNQGGPEPESVFIMHPSNMNNHSPYQTVFRGVVTHEYTYAIKEDEEYVLYDNRGRYQQPNLLGRPGYDAVRAALWRKTRDWMKKAETPYIDQWFARAAIKEVKAWNKEHGLGDTDDRTIGKQAIFNADLARPQES